MLSKDNFVASVWTTVFCAYIV